MLKHFCDHCDQPFAPSQLAVIRGVINAKTRPPAVIGPWDASSDDTFAELCPDCLTELHGWLRTKEKGV